MSTDRAIAQRGASGAAPLGSSEQSAALSLLKPPRPTLRFATILLTIMAVLILFGLVGFQALIVRHQGVLDDLDARVSAATTTNQKLRLEVAQLEAPDRIRTIATEIYGMVDPAANVSYLEPISADQLLAPGSSNGPE